MYLICIIFVVNKQINVIVSVLLFNILILVEHFYLNASGDSCLILISVNLNKPCYSIKTIMTVYYKSRHNACFCIHPFHCVLKEANSP